TNQMMKSGYKYWIYFSLISLIICNTALSQNTGLSDEQIRQQARSDAVDDFKVKPWLTRCGGFEFCTLFLTGSSLMPDYPYRSRALEVALLVGVPSYFAYKKKVDLPVNRRNHLRLQTIEYQNIYLQEYLTSTKQLRLFNTFSGAGIFALSFMALISILPS
ncbi:MAG: hypothetical protein ABIA75_10945, partial [Candidatus Neomarinimicrobiota bacterium]